jgi:hypothetical protein
MHYEKVIALIQKELEQAIGKHPKWPTDMIHAAAVIGEESGELTQACLDYHYKEKEKEIYGTSRMQEEAVQVGAMAIRFLLNLKGKNEN